MGERAMIAIRYRNRYYCLYSQWAYPSEFGERMVQLLAQFGDVEYWRQLMERAMVVVIDWDGTVAASPPSDEFLDALRRHYSSSPVLKERWIHSVDDNFQLGFCNPESKAEISKAHREMRAEENGEAVQQVRARLSELRKEAQSAMFPDDSDSEEKLFLEYGPVIWSRIKMEEALGDAAKFKSICLERGWRWICKQAPSSPSVYHDLLKLGVLSCTEEAAEEMPSDWDIAYKYVIDLDSASFYCDNSHHELTFKLGSIPRNWLQCLMLPQEWVMLGYAYTQQVDDLISKSLEEKFMWSLVVDRLCSPWEFQHYRTKVKLVREFLFAEYDAKEGMPWFTKFLMEEDDEDKDWGPLPLLMGVYSVPSPFLELLGEN